MIEFYEEAHHFLSYFTPEEKKALFYELTRVLHKYNESLTRKTFWNERIVLPAKPAYRCKQLFQCKNHHNEEIVIREVRQGNFFQQQSYFEVFFNFKEISFEFIKKIIELLQYEIYPVGQFAIN